MYHATSPLDEPDDDFDSVRGRLTPAQWDSLLTPGTRIHRRWLAQIDSVAVLLADLRDAGIPVLWRPYHEMNGAWFWWGMHGGDYRRLWRRIYERVPQLIDPLTDLISFRLGTVPGGDPAIPRARTATVVPLPSAPAPKGFGELWRMMYDRFTKHHGLHNLLWVWSVSPPGQPGVDLIDPIEPYYPGHRYVDVLAVDDADLGPGDFDPALRDRLVDLGKGKPVAITEMGRLTDAAAGKDWAFTMIWRANGFEHNSVQEIRHFFQNPHVLTLEDLRALR
jgi:mannan endo-1,4-beta-mannosidase